MQQINLGDIVVDVVQKDIKHLHLSVYPPTGRVKIAAPERMNIDTIRIYAISKLDWIRKQQAKQKAQEREAPRDYLTRESHYYLGKRYLLKVIERDAAPTVILKQRSIDIYVRPGADRAKKQEVLESWYRQQLKDMIPGYISKWEKKMGVSVAEFAVKKMRTKWGTCNASAARVWLNLELVKKPSQCIEYIVVHEMTHLLERSHNARFVAYMDKFLPQWRQHKHELNKLPVSHVNWGY
jgi:predicted metal-dependent hydrolase